MRSFTNLSLEKVKEGLCLSDVTNPPSLKRGGGINNPFCSKFACML